MSIRGCIVNVATPVVVLVLFCAGCFMLYKMAYPLSAGLDDSQAYLVDLSDVLGPDWQMGSPYHLEPLRADLWGFDRRIIGHTCLNAWYKDNPLAFVKQCAFVYQNASLAHDRYTQQRSLYDSETAGIGPSYKYVQFPLEQTLGADDKYLGCAEASTNQFCVALLRYGDHVVFVNSVLVREGITYLSENAFFNIVQTIDWSIQDLGNIS